MKTTKFFEINGDTYQTKEGLERPYYNWKTDIFQLYARPSNTKISIFRYWERKLDEITALRWNSMFFSIYGKITDNNWEVKNVWITPSHNYIEK